MGLTIIKKGSKPEEPKQEQNQPAVEEQKPEQTATQAVAEFANKGGKVPLMLIHKETGKVWSVVGHDTATRHTTLTDTTGMLIKPILTAREDKIYSVMWRE